MTVGRDVVVVSGPDTWSFLQSLLSQDLDGMVDGERRATLLLTPQGKIDVLAGITRRDAVTAVLDTDRGWGRHLADALTGFKIRTRVEIAVEPAGAPIDDAEAEEADHARVIAGIPRMGSELDDTVIPQEAFLERHAVSFTKGCFVGQELVCRIDTRGHVNRYLRHLLPVDEDMVLTVGSEIVADDGRVVGSVTSSAPGVALGYVRREVDPPAPVTVDGHAATVRALP
jgi:folate-binding protein YgfZ